MCSGKCGPQAPKSPACDRAPYTCSQQLSPRLLSREGPSQLARWPVPFASSLLFLVASPPMSPLLCMALWPGTPPCTPQSGAGACVVPLVTGGGNVSKISFGRKTSAPASPCHNFEAGLGKQTRSLPFRDCATLARHSQPAPLAEPHVQGRVCCVGWCAGGLPSFVFRGVVAVGPTSKCLRLEGTPSCLFGVHFVGSDAGTPQARRDYLSRLSFLGESLTECGGLSKCVLSLSCGAAPWPGRGGRRMSSARRVRSQVSYTHSHHLSLPLPS